ncbi:YetF domain-containing protein, partial [Paenibacillus sp. TAF58]
MIDQGKLVIPNLRILRISVDDLEKRLRMAGISRIEDVKSGTIEDNGELGYDLYPHAKPVTQGHLESILKSYFQVTVQPTPQPERNISAEVKSDSHRKE